MGRRRRSQNKKSLDVAQSNSGSEISGLSAPKESVIVGAPQETTSDNKKEHKKKKKKIQSSKDDEGVQPTEENNSKPSGENPRNSPNEITDNESRQSPDDDSEERGSRTGSDTPTPLKESDDNDDDEPAVEISIRPTSDSSALTQLRDMLSPPGALFKSPYAATCSLKILSQFLYARILSLHNKSFGGMSLQQQQGMLLEELYTDDMDAEAIWSQVEMLNEVVVSHLRKNLKKLRKEVKKEEGSVRLLDTEFDGDDEHSTSTEEGGIESNDEEDDVDDEAKRIRERMERAMADMSGSESDQDSSAETPAKSTEVKTKQASNEIDPAAEELNDGFFSLHEMEDFADLEEAYHDFDAAPDERKYRDDDEIDALDALYKNLDGDDGSEEDVANMTASDFYGEPDTTYLNKKTERKNGNGIKGVSDNYAGDNAKKNSSTHDKQSQKLETQIKTLEEKALSSKPWQMTGETSGTSRPVDSLLMDTPAFEMASKQAPIITDEHTKSLEDIIKARIKDEDWDDVIPRETHAVKDPRKNAELPEVSQEKSKLSLGELYEREYLKKAKGVDVTAEENRSKEDKLKDEISGIFTELCSRLDALSNYHFAPRPIKDDDEIKPTKAVPAIAAEEVLPFYVNENETMAPEEVYDKKVGRAAVLKGDDELTKDERKARRTAKKTARRKARKEKEADDRLLSKLSPGLGLNNPYEKRKMREELALARARGKVVTGQRDTEQDYGKSKTFFKRLQDEVKGEVGKKRRLDSVQDGDDGKGKKRGASSSYML